MKLVRRGGIKTRGGDHPMSGAYPHFKPWLNSDKGKVPHSFLQVPVTVESGSSQSRALALAPSLDILRAALLLRGKASVREWL